MSRCEYLAHFRVQQPGSGPSLSVDRDPRCHVVCVDQYILPAHLWSEGLQDQQNGVKLQKVDALLLFLIGPSPLCCLVPHVGIPTQETRVCRVTLWKTAMGESKSSL